MPHYAVTIVEHVDAENEKQARAVIAERIYEQLQAGDAPDMEVAESTPAREPNNPVLTEYQIRNSSTTECLGCEETILSDRAEYVGEDQPYCPTCAAERGM